MTYRVKTRRSNRKEDPYERASHQSLKKSTMKEAFSSNSNKLTFMVYQMPNQTQRAFQDARFITID